MSWYYTLFGEGNVVRERSFTPWNDFRDKARKDVPLKKLESSEIKEKKQERKQLWK